MSGHSLRGRATVVGLDENTYYKVGQAPDSELKLTLKAILVACRDANIDPRSVDGFSSFGNDRSTPSRIAAALGLRQLRSAQMQWSGGGGAAAAVANGAAAIMAGLAETVVVIRSLAQGQHGRFGQSAPVQTVEGEMAYQMPYGLLSPPQKFALRARRYMPEHGGPYGLLQWSAAK